MLSLLNTPAQPRSGWRILSRVLNVYGRKNASLHHEECTSFSVNDLGGRFRPSRVEPCRFVAFHEISVCRSLKCFVSNYMSTNYYSIMSRASPATGVNVLTCIIMLWIMSDYATVGLLTQWSKYPVRLPHLHLWVALGNQGKEIWSCTNFDVRPAVIFVEHHQEKIDCTTETLSNKRV